MKRLNIACYSLDTISRLLPYDRNDWLASEASKKEIKIADVTQALNRI